MRRRPASRGSRRNERLGYALVAPAVLMELAIHIIPIGLGVWIAFLGLNQLTIANWTRASFVGLKNFVSGLSPDGTIGAELFASLGRTVVFTILVVGISWMLAMAAAVYLSTSFRGRGFLRTLFLVPYALPAYVSAIAWAFMFNYEDGIVNAFLVDVLQVGERPFWLSGGNAFIVIVVVSIWQLWPFAFLMLLAALQAVPHDVYEAASLDGATNWRQFWSMTLPMVRPTNTILLLILSLWTFNQFDVPYVIFGATPPESAMLISPLIYQHSFVNWNFGLGAAMSVLLVVLLVAASLTYARLVLPKEDKR